MGNLCEDLVSQWGREVGFLRPTQIQASNSSTDQGGGKRRPVIAEYFFVLIEIA